MQASNASCCLFKSGHLWAQADPGVSSPLLEGALLGQGVRLPPWAASPKAPTSPMAALGRLLPAVLAVAYLTVAERKGLGALQRRVGPEVVGPLGLGQAFADALKLVLKEAHRPGRAGRATLLGAPLGFLLASLMGFAVLPGWNGVPLVDSAGGLLLVLVWLSAMTYGTVYGGKGTGSYFATVGAVRAAAQMVSYELAFGSALLALVLLGEGFSLPELAGAPCAPLGPLLPLGAAYAVSLLAELNRTPFDLPEGESELVAGYMTEYASVPFVCFFLGEYGSLLFTSLLSAALWAGGGAGGALAVAAAVVAVRGTLPRLRYDQLVGFGWLQLLPLASGALLPVLLAVGA